jgi:hypothetical protein
MHDSGDLARLGWGNGAEEVVRGERDVWLVVVLIMGSYFVNGVECRRL